MKRLRAKLTGSRGETLVELLVSILVATLSVGLLMAGVAVSAQLNQRAREKDQVFYDTLTAAENRLTPITPVPTESPRVRIAEGSTEIFIPVQVYGGEALYSYGEAGDPP